MHSSDSLRVRGYEFPSNSFNVDQRFQVQISPMRLPSKSEGHRCLKYQNVPYIRNFWHIGKPWERFQHWVRLVYFLTVPDDHTVVDAHHGKLIQTKFRIRLSLWNAKCGALNFSFNTFDFDIRWIAKCSTLSDLIICSIEQGHWVWTKWWKNSFYIPFHPQKKNQGQPSYFSIFQGQN